MRSEKADMEASMSWSSFAMDSKISFSTFSRNSSTTSSSDRTTSAAMTNWLVLLSPLPSFIGFDGIFVSLSSSKLQFQCR